MVKTKFKKETKSHVVFPKVNTETRKESVNREEGGLALLVRESLKLQELMVNNRPLGNTFGRK